MSLDIESSVNTFLRITSESVSKRIIICTFKTVLQCFRESSFVSQMSYSQKQGIIKSSSNNGVAEWLRVLTCAHSIIGLSPTSACICLKVCGSKRISCHASCQEVSRCWTRFESEKSIACR